MSRDSRSWTRTTRGHAGYDPVSVTGIVPGGANVDLDHQREGVGARIHAGAEHQVGHELRATRGHERRDSDVSAERILGGSATVEEVGTEIYRLVLAVKPEYEIKSK
jgi:altronate hydrolase